jgi:hypothetical protein
MAPFNTRAEYQFTNDFSSIDTSTQGANATWNQTGVTPAGDFVMWILDPSVTPQGGSFPLANYVQYEESIGRYSYFRLTPDTMERVGSWTGTLNTYTDPQVEYVFPLTLGTSHDDTWASTSSSFGGTYDLDCVGFGTLQLPGSTHTDVLMVRVLQSELTSFTVYFWYDSNNGLPLMLYTEGDGLFLPPYALYFTSLSVGTGEPAALDAQYNNPVGNDLYLSLRSESVSDLQYDLVDMKGCSVGRGEVVLSPGMNRMVIDMAGYSDGIYCLSLFSGGKKQTIKVVKG